MNTNASDDLTNPMIAYYASQAAAHAARNPGDPNAQQQAQYWATRLSQQTQMFQGTSVPAAPPAPAMFQGTSMPTAPQAQTQYVQHAVPSFTPPMPVPTTLDMSAVHHGYAERVVGGRHGEPSSSAFATATHTPVGTPRRARSTIARGR